MNKPAISIIIPLYNKEKYIKEVLDSVAKQDFKNFEVIAVDDGSTDNSPLLVEKYPDNRIHLIKKQNGGVSSARNYGLQFTQGEYIFYLDGDDKLESNALNELIDLAKKYPDCDIYTGNFIQVYPNIPERLYCKGKYEYIVKDNFKDFYKQKFYMRTGIFMVKKICLTESSGFNENLNVGEDFEFFLRLISKYKIAYTPVCIFKYIKEASELSKSHSNSQNLLSIIELKNYKGFQKRIYGEQIAISMFISLLSFDFKKFSTLWSCNHKHIFYLLKILPHGLLRIIRNNQIVDRFLIKIKR